MRAGLTGRVAKIRATVPEGCWACRAWPLVRYLRENDLAPPTDCEACGRVWHRLARVIRIVRVEREDGIRGG